MPKVEKASQLSSISASQSLINCHLGFVQHKIDAMERGNDDKAYHKHVANSRPCLVPVQNVWVHDPTVVPSPVDDAEGHVDDPVKEGPDDVEQATGNAADQVLYHNNDRVEQVDLQVLQVNAGVVGEHREEEQEEHDGHHQRCCGDDVEQHPHHTDVPRRAEWHFKLHMGGVGNLGAWDVLIAAAVPHAASGLHKHKRVGVRAGSAAAVTPKPTSAVLPHQQVMGKRGQEVRDKVEVEHDVGPVGEVGSPGLRRAATVSGDIAKPEQAVDHQEKTVAHVHSKWQAPLQPRHVCDL